MRVQCDGPIYHSICCASCQNGNHPFDQNKSVCDVRVKSACCEGVEEVQMNSRNQWKHDLSSSDQFADCLSGTDLQLRVWPHFSFEPSRQVL